MCSRRRRVGNDPDQAKGRASAHAESAPFRGRARAGADDKFLPVEARGRTLLRDLSSVIMRRHRTGDDPVAAAPGDGFGHALILVTVDEAIGQAIRPRCCSWSLRPGPCSTPVRSLRPGVLTLGSRLYQWRTSSAICAVPLGFFERRMSANSVAGRIDRHHTVDLTQGWSTSDRSGGITTWT